MPVFAALLSLAPFVPAPVHAAPAVLDADDFARHVEFFNRMEDETVVNLVPNAQAWDWMRDRVPLFECSDAEVEEIYWFRWWALRKHLKKAATSGRFIFTEFITKDRTISSALGHDLMEGRWLRDQTFHDDFVLYWLRGNNGGPQGHLHNYSQWLQHALLQRWLVTQDTAGLVALLDDLLAHDRKWDEDKRLASGLYWQFDVRDAMEESISGSRTKKNIRPTINSYMYGNARALAAIARLAGRDELGREYDAKAEEIRRLAVESMWDADAEFFKVRLEDGGLSDAREAIGFIPWYFGMAGPEHAAAWAQFTDPRGFRAPFGITTAERRHPEFRSHGVGTCEWDGAVWPFATSQTLTALGNFLRSDGRQSPDVSSRDHFDAFKAYVRSQHYDGLPYIGEYLDENTGLWLKGRDPRSRWYNHSTFADLLIAGVIGLRPRADNVVEVDPLLPAGAWKWFCLDRVRYHGRDLTILWDRDGTRYGRGAGLRVFVDGKEIAHAAGLERVEGRIP